MLAQQVSVKLYARDPGSVDLARFIPIFHRWIQESRLPGRLLFDVADYRHVPDGPGVVLIAHEAHYAIDSEQGPLGLLCTRRRDPAGELEAKLIDGLRDALSAARLLEEDPERPISFRTDRARISILSRQYAPNTVDTWQSARGVLDAVAGRLYAGAPVKLEHLDDPRAPFGVELEAPDAPPLGALLERIL